MTSIKIPNPLFNDKIKIAVCWQVKKCYIKALKNVINDIMLYKLIDNFL